jgi:hypothetical protein
MKAIFESEERTLNFFLGGEDSVPKEEEKKSRK